MQYLYLSGIVFTSSLASEAFYQNQLPFLVLRTPAKSRPQGRCGCHLRLIITTVQCFRAVIVRDIVSNYPLPKPKLDFMRTMEELEKYVLLHQDLSLRATPRFIGDAAEQWPLPSESEHSVVLLSQLPPRAHDKEPEYSSASFFKPSSHENRVTSIRPSPHDSCGPEVRFEPWQNLHQLCKLNSPDNRPRDHLQAHRQPQNNRTSSRHKRRSSHIKQKPQSKPGMTRRILVTKRRQTLASRLQYLPLCGTTHSNMADDIINSEKGDTTFPTMRANKREKI